MKVSQKLSKLVAMAVLLGGVTCSSSVWAGILMYGTLSDGVITITGSAGSNSWSQTNYVGVDTTFGNKSLGADISKIQTVSGGVDATVYGIKVTGSSSVSATAISDGIVVASSDTTGGAYGIYFGNSGPSCTNSIAGLKEINASTSGNESYGIYAVNGTNTVTFATDGTIKSRASEDATGPVGIKLVGGLNTIGDGTLKGVSAESSASAWTPARAIYVTGGTNTIKLSGASSYISTVVTDDMGARGIEFDGTGTTSVFNLGSITAETSGTDFDADAYGIYAKNTNTDDKKFSVSFVDAGGSVVAYSAGCNNYGIMFDSGSTGTSEVLNVKTITAGVKSGSSPEVISTGAAYGIQAMAGTNTVTFTGTNPSIAAKSSGSDAYGIAYGYIWSGSSNTATGTTEVKGLGKIIAETASTDATYKQAYGIYACNGNAAGADADPAAFSVAFATNEAKTTGGTINAYSAEGESYGIKFDSAKIEETPGSGTYVEKAVGKNEVLNVNKIEVGVKSGSSDPEVIGSDTAYGIQALSGTNTVTFTGTDRSITVKSKGVTGSVSANAYGISYGKWNDYMDGGNIKADEKGASGVTTITGIKNITTEATGTNALTSCGIASCSDTLDAELKITFTGAGSSIVATGGRADYGVMLFAGSELSYGQNTISDLEKIVAKGGDKGSIGIGFQGGMNKIDWESSTKLKSVESGDETQDGMAYGIYAITIGENRVAFSGAESFITAKSGKGEVFGILVMGGYGGTEFTNIGSITAETLETTAGANACGIYGMNIDVNNSFVVSFATNDAKTTGGTISVYSASGDNYGIQFASKKSSGVEKAVGKNEVLNVNKITVGVKGSAIGSDTAFGIQAMAGTNTVAFTGADRSITVKSKGVDGSVSANAYGISYGKWNNYMDGNTLNVDEECASGVTTITGIKNITTDATGTNALMSCGVVSCTGTTDAELKITFTGAGSSIVATGGKADYGVMVALGSGSLNGGKTTISDLEKIVVRGGEVGSIGIGLQGGINEFDWESSTKLKSIESGDETQTGFAYGIYTCVTGENKIAFSGAESSITAKSGGYGAYGICLLGSTDTEITGLGSITAISMDTAYGISATNTNTDNAEKCSVVFADAGGSISVYSAYRDNYGIKFDSEKVSDVEKAVGKNEVLNVNKVAVGMDPADPTNSAKYSAGAAYGIQAMAGQNTVEFIGTDRSITAKSAYLNEDFQGADAYGIAFGTAGIFGIAAATGTTTVTGLDSITAETTAAPMIIPEEATIYYNAYGIYACNGNASTGSDKFSVSFADAGGTINTYSAKGESYGIKFDNADDTSTTDTVEPTGKSEVLNVKSITAGVKDSAVSSEAACGIQAMAGTNTVAFVDGSSIEAKSTGADAYGISYGLFDLGSPVTAAGTTTITGLGKIVVDTTSQNADCQNAYGIYSDGTDANSELIISFKGNSGTPVQAITATSANGSAYSIYAEGAGKTTVNFEDSILSGKISQTGTNGVILNFNNGGVWNPVTGDVTGSVDVNLNNGSKLTIDKITDLSGGAVNIATESGATFSFDLPADYTKDSAPMLKMNGSALTIGDGSIVQVNDGKATALKVDDEVCLIQHTAQNITLGNITKQAGTDGIKWTEAEIYLNETDSKKLMYKVVQKTLDPDGSKAPVEGVAAAAVLANSSSDMATGVGMANLITSTSTVVNSTETFGAGNFGKGKYKTGSHVDAEGYGIVVGIGKKGFNPKGDKITGGLFFEYGNSDFDTYNNDVTGSGKAIYKGGGYMMRYDSSCGNYYEGMVHIGKVTTSWGNASGSYEIAPRYYGGAMSYGHKFMVAKDRQLSVYGSYIYTHTDGADAKIGEYDYTFDATKSQRSRIGVRYAVSDLMDTNKFRPYFGLIWEHEYNGKSKAHVAGFEEGPAAPSMKGNTGIMEVGFKQDTGKWTLGIGAELFTGKRKGWNGTLQATFNF